MNSTELIGLVGLQFLKAALSGNDENEGLARFILDRLTGHQVAEISQHIWADAELRERIEIKIPRSFVEGLGLPDEVLTDDSMVFWRNNTECVKSAILLVNANDDQGQSLGQVTAIGATELKSSCEYWVDVASRETGLSGDHRKMWALALKALQEARSVSLEQFAEYVAAARRQMVNESVPLKDALGWALSALDLPRDSAYFASIKETDLGKVSVWQKRFQEVVSKRACFLRKETPTRRLIDREELRENFKKVKETIPAEKRGVVQAFVESSPGFGPAAKALTELEWESDNINSLFQGLKAKSVDLASTTIEYFDTHFTDTLSDEQIQYLKTLRGRVTKEPIDEDKEFYESYRQELEGNPSLKAKWDKFIYGQPIECTDFTVGLLAAVERLFERTGNPYGKKSLVIKTQKKTKKSWLDLNADTGLYFCVRYRGLETLTSPEAHWETQWLFKYDKLLNEAKDGRKYKPNTSTARAATEIKFQVELHYRAGREKKTEAVQLVWRANSNGIGTELHGDLVRLAKNPLLTTQVHRELVSRKGKLQGIALDDVSTLRPAFRQDRGSLISPYDSKSDLSIRVPAGLKEAVKTQRLHEAEAAALKAVWEAFSDSYAQAIQCWLSNEGISDQKLLDQLAAYQQLLDTLLNKARGDINRNALYVPILKLGCVEITGGKPAAIIAPWHPLRIAAIAIKARQFAGLLKHILNADRVDFGDSRLFFNDLKSELAHPYYPEVCVGYSGHEPKLLCGTDTVNDYSLMERPVRDDTEQATNEDPSEAASTLIGLTHRYLELLPHERTNLTLVLYNCDSTRLPQMVANKLSAMEEEQEEVRCQVTLRHRDMKKLNRLYREMLEGFDAAPDSYVASEMSQDYMAKLRIGIMADQAPTPDPREGKPADIVFLQDVISRQAVETWLDVISPNNSPELLDHIPPRWSRKRQAEPGELKSIAYLVCPIQPEVESSYVEVVYGLIKAQNAQDGLRHLPARQISFQSQEAKKILDEIHQLGEWVVNYDSLLERRQLVNQKISVIRYRHSGTGGNNLIVSSNASLTLLKVLVKRRLAELNLALPENELSELTERFISEANVVSGDIILRAAKSGKHASELIGVVLSKALVAEESGGDWPIGWYFLDDYASWLGQAEEQIADILAICPKVVDGKPMLKMTISEAKYVAEAGMAEAQRKSQKQLRETVNRIESAVFGNPGRLDRDLWLSRISDLLLEGIEMSGNSSSFSLDDYRRLIRSGEIEIDLSGYSHVFISSPDGSTKGGEQEPVSNAARCYQEIFSREQVRNLVLAFHQRQPLAQVREQLGAERPWENSLQRPPAPRVSWVRPHLEKAAMLDSEEVVVPTRDESQPPRIEESMPAVSKSQQTNGGSETQTTADSSPSVATVPEDQPAPPDGLNNWLKQNAADTPQDSQAEAWLSETVQSLKAALISYDLQAKVLGQRLTPNAAIIRLMGSDRLKVEDIEKKRSQLRTTHRLTVINVVGLPGEIMVSVARPEREQISLAKVWAERKVNESSGINLSLVVGVKEVDGEILYLNLGSGFEGLQQHAPHTLIAGATGSGKSVLLRNLLLDICATNPPHLSKVCLIDPKAGVDYFVLEELPHLGGGIVIDQDHAIETLQKLVIEMDNRYLQFRKQKVSNLTAYNAKVGEHDRLPVLWCVHDEFAEWMLVDSYRDEVSSIVQRLGVKARAAGIHLIFAAQRPDATVLPVQLRDNLGNRLILRVESVGTSEISLGQKGAENLLGKGHLIARLSGESDLIYAQVPFISDEEAAELVEMIKRRHSSD